MTERERKIGKHFEQSDKTKTEHDKIEAVRWRRGGAICLAYKFTRSLQPRWSSAVLESTYMLMGVRKRDRTGWTTCSLVWECEPVSKTNGNKSKTEERKKKERKIRTVK